VLGFEVGADYPVIMLWFGNCAGQQRENAFSMQTAQRVAALWFDFVAALSLQSLQWLFGFRLIE
jgi:hypothetical protein